MSIFVVLFSLVLSLIAYLCVKLRRHQTYWQSRGIPCEKPESFFDFFRGPKNMRPMREIWLDCYNKFKGTGPFLGLYWSGQPAAFVLDTALAKQVLIKEFNKFVDRGFYSNEKDDPLLGGQLFFLEGHRWRNMRNKLSPTFTSGKMKYMFPTVQRVAAEFERTVDIEVQANSVIEIKDILARFTTDVIGSCAFGIECNSLREPNNMFRVMGKKAISGQRKSWLKAAIIKYYPNLARRLHYKQMADDVAAFFMSMVQGTVEYREKNNIKRNDFMDLLLELKNNKLMRSEHGAELTNLSFKQLAAQAVLFFNAGFETSSTTMGFAMYELALHPDIQARAREEIQAVLAKYDGKLEYESVKELKYVEQIIQETLRLYTVLPMLNRFALEDFMVPGYPKYVIKKGMHVIIPAGAMHRDERLYPNPHIFNPDNFTPQKVRERDSVEWLPFGDGPRNCIGMRFGMMQTCVGLAVLLKNYKFSVAAPTPVPMKYNPHSFMLASDGGIFLKVEKI